LGGGRDDFHGTKKNCKGKGGKGRKKRVDGGRAKGKTTIRAPANMFRTGGTGGKKKKGTEHPGIRAKSDNDRVETSRESSIL